MSKKYKYKGFSALPYYLHNRFDRLTETEKIEAALQILKDERKDECKKRDAQIKTERQRFELLKRLTPLEQEIWKLEKDNESIFRKIFGNPTIATIRNYEISAKKKILSRSKANIDQKYPYEERVFSPNQGVVEFLENRLKQAKRQNDKLEKDRGLRAKVAAAAGQTRNHAKVVKRSLERSDDCPYCGGSMGQDPHADHIYPVSKGGLSAEKNMVYVCQNCNLNKGDDTLATFIRAYGLDRDRIENQLAIQGKEY